MFRAKCRKNCVFIIFLLRVIKSGENGGPAYKPGTDPTLIGYRTRVLINSQVERKRQILIDLRVIFII